MKYRLVIKQAAEKDIRRLPNQFLRRINQQIINLGNDPRPPGIRKLSGKLDGWRVRVGDYRIVYQIDDDEKKVTVIRIRHRRDVYQ